MHVRRMGKFALQRASRGSPELARSAAQEPTFAHRRRTYHQIRRWNPCTIARGTVARATTHLALDLAHIECFDAAGLQLLLSIERTLGSGLTVENPSPEVAGILYWTPEGAHCTSAGDAAERRPTGISLAVRNPARDALASDTDWLIGVGSRHLSL